MCEAVRVTGVSLPHLSPTSVVAIALARCTGPHGRGGGGAGCFFPGLRCCSVQKGSEAEALPVLAVWLYVALLRDASREQVDLRPKNFRAFPFTVMWCSRVNRLKTKLVGVFFCKVKSHEAFLAEADQKIQRAVGRGNAVGKRQPRHATWCGYCVMCAHACLWAV